VTVVLASRGYPESSSSGDVITGLDEVEDAEVYHAATARAGDEFVTAGGRVLAVTGLGPGPAEARDRAYAAVERIDFDGRQVRTDIAARAVRVDKVGS
jgi:phosphoribosylamine--glycine ligase